MLVDVEEVVLVLLLGGVVVVECEVLFGVEDVEVVVFVVVVVVVLDAVLNIVLILSLMRCLELV